MTEVGKGDRVRLMSLDGRRTAPKHTYAAYNYWKLIGKSGKVIALPSDVKFTPENLRLMKDSVCVKFDESVVALGLDCHNDHDPIMGPGFENALWIGKSDLARLPAAKSPRSARTRRTPRA